VIGNNIPATLSATVFPARANRTHRQTKILHNIHKQKACKNQYSTLCVAISSIFNPIAHLPNPYHPAPKTIATRSNAPAKFVK
jgi:hypothetical protein